MSMFATMAEFYLFVKQPDKHSSNEAIWFSSAIHRPVQSRLQFDSNEGHNE